MKTKTRIAGLTLAIIALLVLTGCLRPLSGKQPGESAASATTIAAAEATQAAAQATKAAAVQVIAQATQNAQRPATAVPARNPAPTVTPTPAHNATSMTIPSTSSPGTRTGGNPLVPLWEVPGSVGTWTLQCTDSGCRYVPGAPTNAATSPTPVVLDINSAAQLRYGDMITKELKSLGDMGTYVFDGKAGDIAFVVASGTADASWLELQVKLFDPQGKPVAAGSEGRGEYKLAADGRYVFTVRDVGTRIGPYNVLLKNASPGAGIRLAYGAVVNTAITVSNDVHFYSFSGKAGDVVRIAITARGRGEWLVHLLDPQRGYLGLSKSSSTNSTGIIEKALTVDGEYTIRIYATGILDSPTTGPYALLVKNVAGAAGTRLIYGDVVTGTIAPEGDKDVYVFEWKAGEKAVIEAETGTGRLSSGFNPQVEVFDSKGNSLAKGPTSYAQPVVQLKPLLSEGGIYVVTVEGKLHVHWDSGNYTLSLKNLNAP